MKRKKTLLSLCIILVFISLNGCNRKTSLISYPDKIIVYSNGKGEIIKKSHPSYNNIVMLTNKRFNSKVCTKKQQNVINIEKSDFLSLEFIYNEEQEFNLVGENVSEFAYTRLYFPLMPTEQQKDMEGIMYYGDGMKYNSNSLINLSTSYELINEVSNIMETK